MKLVELRCKNYGSLLERDEDENIVTCDYCHTTFEIDDEVQYIRYDTAR